MAGSDPSGYPVVMDVPMVAEMLLADVHQVRKWANAGLIPCHRIPGTRKYRFVRDEVLEWLAGLPGGDVPDGEVPEEGGVPDPAEHAQGRLSAP